MYKIIGSGISLAINTVVRNDNYNAEPYGYW